LCAQMHAAFDAGDLTKAQELDQRLIHIHRAMFFSPSPGPAKHVLSKMGVCSDEVRLPIVMPNAATRARIDEAISAAGLE
jgi:4-hydroxy-tetrahydrodipicolinate synthase